MFNQANETKPLKTIKDPETIIGPSVKVEGNFKGDGDVVVEGEVKGTLKTKKDLRVGEGANIKANVEANNAHISGKIQGNIKIKDKLELTPTAIIIGDITTKVLQIAAGAKVNGVIKMEDESMIQEAATKLEIENSDKSKKKN